MYRKFDALSYLNEPVSGVGVIVDHPFITGLEDAIVEDVDTKYIILGGVKILNLLNKANHISDVVEFPTEFQIKHSDILLQNLRAGMFYDYEKFDQAYYGNLGLPLLNNNAEYIAVKDNLTKSFTEDKFVKPSRDLKAFDAGILKAGQTVEEYILSKPRQRFFMEEDLVVADVVNIKDEVRFFVVNKKIVGKSSYKVDYSFGESTYINPKILEKAQEYAELYQPADVFTMDLCLTEDDKVLIIEYNCFNCSGVYLSDMVNTYKELKNFILTK
jgi:hypothetical protein